MGFGFRARLHLLGASGQEDLEDTALKPDDGAHRTHKS